MTTRARFSSPIGDPLDPAFADLLIAAAFGDTADRAPTEADWAYWRGVMPGLNARGLEIRYGGDDAAAGRRYAWDRLIGWQAGGADVPAFGPYANPPNGGPAAGWQTPLIDVAGSTPDPVPVPPPVDPPPLALVLARLVVIEAKQDQLALQIDRNTQELRDQINELADQARATFAAGLPTIRLLLEKVLMP